MVLETVQSLKNRIIFKIYGQFHCGIAHFFVINRCLHRRWITVKMFLTIRYCMSLKLEEQEMYMRLTPREKDMASMFAYSEFNGDISKWDVSNVVDIRHMFENSPLEKNPPKWYKD